MDFEPTGMALVTQWFLQHGVAIGLGLLIGSIGTAVTFYRKLIQLRREGVL